MQVPLLGCIADDYTGASDVSGSLAEAGMSVVLYFGTPQSTDATHNADAVVIALRTRSSPVAFAVEQSLSAIRSLRTMGTTRFYFKISSTFDSNEKGNIGPVAEALLDTLNSQQTVVCPANPTYDRTVYRGHLFVGDRLLSESGMEHHPLTPMRDADLVRVLSKQTNLGIGIATHEVVDSGWNSLERRLHFLGQANKRLVIVDALNGEHIQTIASVCAKMELAIGSSGLALALPDAYRALGLLSPEMTTAQWNGSAARTAILAGSCSHATQEQVAFMKARYPTYELDVRECHKQPREIVDRAMDWACRQPDALPLLFYSTADAFKVSDVQSALGRTAAASTVENFFGELAFQLAAKLHVGNFIVAGGETAGAVVSRLGIRALRIGPRIAPGVPWAESVDARRFRLALKAGNFGDSDFFQKALALLA